VIDLTLEPESPISLSLEWRTDVIVARSGLERRAAQRSSPRWMLTMTLRLQSEADIRRLRWMLSQKLGESWRVPVWHKPARVTADAASGQAVVDLDNTKSDIVAGDWVFLRRRDGTVSEFGTVSVASASQLTLSGNLANTYAAGSRVYLAVEALLREQQGISRWPVNAAEVSLVADVLRHRSPGGGGGSVSLYRGLPIIGDPPAGEQFEESYEAGKERADFGARVALVRGWDRGRATYPRSLHLGGRADLADVEALLEDLVGMREPFWLPTWTPDFAIVSAPSGSSTPTVSDDPVGYIAAWYAAERNPHIQAEDASGNTSQHRVTAVAGTPTVTLTLNYPLPFTATKISLLQLVRLGSDQVEIEYGYARGRLGFVARTLDEVLAEIEATGIASAQAFGTARLDGNIRLDVFGGNGIPSAEALGAARLDGQISGAGDIPSGGSFWFGTPTVQGDAAQIEPSAIAGAEAFGTAELFSDPDIFEELTADDSVSNSTFEAVAGFTLAVAANTKYLIHGFAFFDMSDADVTFGLQIDGPASPVRILIHRVFDGGQVMNRWTAAYNTGTAAASFTGRVGVVIAILFENGSTAGNLSVKIRTTDGTDTATALRGSWLAKRTTGLVVLGGDATNAGASSATLADIDPGAAQALELAVTSGVLYWFRFWVAWTADATTTGYRLAVNGPTFTVCVSMVQIAIANNSQVRGGQAGYDAAGPNGSGSQTGENFGYIEGIILPSASGNLIARHAAEANGLSVTAKAGSVGDLIEIDPADPNNGIATGTETENAGTLKDIPGCRVWADADEEFAFEARCIFQSDTTATGAGFGMNGPASPTEFEGFVRIARTDALLAFGRIGAYGDRVESTSTTAATDMIAIITGYFRNGSTAGWLQVQFAREVAAASGTITTNANCAIRKTRLS